MPGDHPPPPGVEGEAAGGQGGQDPAQHQHCGRRGPGPARGLRPPLLCGLGPGEAEGEVRRGGGGQRPGGGPGAALLAPSQEAAGDGGAERGQGRDHPPARVNVVKTGPVLTGW